MLYYTYVLISDKKSLPIKRFIWLYYIILLRMCSSNNICNYFAFDVDVIDRLEHSCLITIEFSFKILNILI